MKIAVIGTGYVGLVTGTCLADVGWDVTCVDKTRRQDRQAEERHHADLRARPEGTGAGQCRRRPPAFHHRHRRGGRHASIVIIAVGTPTRKLDGNADLQYVYAAAAEIARALDHYAVIVTKSTVPAGTGFQIKRIVAEANPGLAFDVASNPEFLREGNAIYDFATPDRIVIGTESEAALALLEDLYRPFTESGVELIRTDLVSSELIKYAANTFLATKVSFINEMADICERVGGNVVDVSRGMGSDKRIGHAFLKPGPGYGGSCFPKDTLAMVHLGETGAQPGDDRRGGDRRQQVAHAPHGGQDRADRRQRRPGESASRFSASPSSPTPTTCGTASAILIADELSQMGAIVRAYDPQGMDQARAILGDAVEYCPSADEALDDADLCVIATEWSEFRERKPSSYKKLMAEPVMVDLRNIFSPDEMADHGFDYVSVGRPPVERTVARGRQELVEADDFRS